MVSSGGGALAAGLSAARGTATNMVWKRGAEEIAGGPEGGVLDSSGI